MMRLGTQQNRMMNFFIITPSWHTVATYDESWGIAQHLAKRGLLEVNSYHQARLAKPLRDIDRWHRAILNRSGSQWDMVTLRMCFPGYEKAIGRVIGMWDTYVATH